MTSIKKLNLSVKKFFSKRIVLFGELEVLITHLFFFGAGVLAGIYFILSNTLLSLPSNPWINLFLFFGVLIYGLISIILFKEKERRKEVDFNLKLFLEMLGYYLGGFLGLMLGLIILLLLAAGILIFIVLTLIPIRFWIIFGSIVIPLIVFWILAGRRVKKEKH